jgi:hypothetical protein
MFEFWTILEDGKPKKGFVSVKKALTCLSLLKEQNPMKVYELLSASVDMDTSDDDSRAHRGSSRLRRTEGSSEQHSCYVVLGGNARNNQEAFRPSGNGRRWSLSVS